MNLTWELPASGNPAFSEPRACGAIALVNVLRHWGINADLWPTWRHVARADPFGTLSAKSYLLASCANSHGLHAATLKCRSDKAWDALTYCTHLGLSVIINHQSHAARNEGHYSILDSITNGTIITSDPTLKRHVKWSRPEFLEHWQQNAETAGYVLVAMGTDTNALIDVPQSRCPKCNTALPLQPSKLFHPEDWAESGLWHYFYCHGCDASYSLMR